MGSNPNKRHEPALRYAAVRKQWAWIVYVCGPDPSRCFSHKPSVRAIHQPRRALPGLPRTLALLAPAARCSSPPLLFPAPEARRKRGQTLKAVVIGLTLTLAYALPVQARISIEVGMGTVYEHAYPGYACPIPGFLGTTSGDGHIRVTGGNGIIGNMDGNDVLLNRMMNGALKLVKKGSWPGPFTLATPLKHIHDALSYSDPGDNPPQGFPANAARGALYARGVRDRKISSGALGALVHHATAAFGIRLMQSYQSPITVKFATYGTSATGSSKTSIGEYALDGSEDFKSVSGTLTFLPGETYKLVTVAIINDCVEDGGEQFHLIIEPPGSGENPTTTGNTDLDEWFVSQNLTRAYTILNYDKVQIQNVKTQASKTVPLTSVLERVPERHGDSEHFWLNVRFSEALGETSHPPTAASFMVQGGKIKRVRKLEPGLWRVRIAPKSWRDVTMTLAGGRSCEEAGAVCTADGRALTNTLAASVGGPVRIRIEGARAKEGKDASLDFAVTLNRAAAQAVSVDYATEDDTATAGADYTATSGTLTFAAGETAKTVSVPVLDDAIDEGKEVMRLLLSNPQGAYLRSMHRQAKGVIRNDDPLQRAWLSRFGRTVAGHVTDAVGDRLRGAPGQESHVTIGGYRLPLGRAATSEPAPGAAPNEAATTTAVLTEVARMLGLGPGAGTGPATPWAAQPDPRRSPGQALPTFRLREVLQGSAFRLNLGATDADAAMPRLTAWGRVAGTTFEGRDGTLDLDGDVLTGTVGLDGTWDRLVLGLAVAHSRGNGGYGMQLNADPARGDLEQTLTSLHPYLRYAVTDRLDVWGLVGYGWGELDLEMANGVTVETDTTLIMGAFGGRGILLAPADTGGFQLATRTDAMLTRTTSDAVTGLAAGTGNAHRLRVLLEGSRGVTWADGRRLTPTVELGVRHDWGDAETGFGLEVGGRVSYADPTLGLTVEGTVRGLVAHEADAYKEWGASGTVRLDPGATGRGLSVTLAPTWGAAASGVEGLWSRQTTQGLAPATQSAPRGRLAADVGYGFAAFGSGLLTPYAGTVLSDGADRTYRVGTRVRLPGLTLNLEGTRQAPTRQPVNQGVRLQVEWGF